MSIFPSLQSGKDSAQYRDSVSFGSRLWRTLELPLYKWVETGVSQSWFYWSHLHPSCRELSMLCHLPCTCNKVGGESTGTEERTQFSGRADTKSTAGLEERKPEAGTLPALPPSLYVPQVHRPASAVTPARAPGPMPIFLRCNERKEQGSLWHREAGRCTLAGVRGAAAIAYHWGHHLFTIQHHCSPPVHTPGAIIKLSSFPAFIAGTFFFPWASQKPTENIPAEEISFASHLTSCFLHHFTSSSFHHTCPSP